MGAAHTKRYQRLVDIAHKHMVDNPFDTLEEFAEGYGHSESSVRNAFKKLEQQMPFAKSERKKKATVASRLRELEERVAMLEKKEEGPNEVFKVRRRKSKPTDLAYPESH